MNKNYSRICLTLGVSAALLAGCGIDPVQPNQDVAMAANYGIAAVVLDTLDPVNNFYIKSADDPKAPEIEVTRVQPGVTLFVYDVPAGSYCVVHYQIANFNIDQNDPTHGSCFDVVAGKVAYSGNLAPRGHNGKIYIYQNYDWLAFEKMLKEQYPKLASIPIVTP